MPYQFFSIKIQNVIVVDNNSESTRDKLKRVIKNRFTAHIILNFTHN